MGLVKRRNTEDILHEIWLDVQTDIPERRSTVLLEKTKGQISNIPYDPQPDSSVVFTVHRYYASLKKDNNY